MNELAVLTVRQRCLVRSQAGQPVFLGALESFSRCMALRLPLLSVLDISFRRGSLWLPLLLVLAGMLGIAQAAPTDHAASEPAALSVMALPLSQASSQPQLAVRWSGELPVQLEQGQQDAAGGFTPSAPPIMLTEPMSLLPHPSAENEHNTFWRVLDAQGQVLAQTRAATSSSSWQRDFLGPGLTGSVFAALVYQGYLVVAGDFDMAGSQQVNNIARWDGSHWTPLSGPVSIGVNNTVRALTVHNGGLIVGGDFTSAGGIAASYLARWNGNQWAALEGSSGPVINQSVYALAVYNDDLIAGGAFGSSAGGLARWDGNDWYAIGEASGPIRALTLYNGQLIAGGNFTSLDGMTVNRVARWNGTSWSALNHSTGRGVTGPVLALTVYNGEVIAGGSFERAGGGGGPLVFNVARWNGSRWAGLSSGLAGLDAEVSALAVFNGELVAAGTFDTTAGGFERFDNIARWNGSRWADLSGPSGIGADKQVHALTIHDGELFVGGDFATVGGVAASHAALWNGSEWASLVPDWSSSIRALTLYNGELIAAGEFLAIGGRLVNRIASWNGSRWAELRGPEGLGLDGTVRALVVHEGELIVAGDFVRAGGVLVNRIARWSGSRWDALDSPSATGMNNPVWALTVHDGELFAGGEFSTAGGVLVNRIARWNGTEWAALIGSLGTGVSGTVLALGVYDSELIVAGSFVSAGGVTVNRIARWDGNEWSGLLGTSATGVSGAVLALTVHNGELVVGGQFMSAGGLTVNRIARWNGSQWATVSGVSGIGTNASVYALGSYNGDLIAGGQFITASGVTVNRVARWDGSRWFALSGPSGNGVSAMVRAVTVFNNNLIVAGDFDTAGVVAADGIARWNGTRWFAMRGVPDTGLSGTVRALLVHDGDLYAGGEFLTAGGLVVNHIARWNGTRWFPLSGPTETGVDGPVYALAILNGELIAGGGFITAGGETVNRVARWDGNQWIAMSASSPGLNGTVTSLTIFRGSLIAGGGFTRNTFGSLRNRVARWDGGTWRSLSQGVDGYVRALTVHNNDLYVGGDFIVANTNIVANRIARWDGSSWSALPRSTTTGVAAPVHALASYQGQLMVAGAFAPRILRWNGSSWSVFSGATGNGPNATIRALVVQRDELIVGGDFNGSGSGAAGANFIARWNGSQWGSLSGIPGTGLDNTVWALALYNDDLIAGGAFMNGDGVPSWRIGRYVRPPFAVGGTVSGLQGTGLVLQLNGNEALPVSANGSFSFDTEQLDGSTYTVTILSQPSGYHEGCTLYNGSGSVPGAPVTDISVVCAPYARAQFCSSPNAAIPPSNPDGLTRSINVPFDGPTGKVSIYVRGTSGYVGGLSATLTHPSGSPAISLFNRPGEGFCVNSNFDVWLDDEGTDGPIQSQCANLPALYGRATPQEALAAFKDLPAKGSWRLKMTAASAQFAPLWPRLQQWCVEIDVSTGLTVGGNVSGLEGSGLVLRNNGGDDLPIAADGSFAFESVLLNGSSYSITVANQPTNPHQTCTVSNGSGSLSGSSVSNVSVSCSTNSFVVGGTVSGLSGSGLVLHNNGGDDLPIAANGAFAFATALVDQSAYAVTVFTQPTDPSQTCTVANASGNLAGANVSTVAVSCVTNTFTVGGTVSGLTGSGLILRNNGGDNLPIATDGSFTFAAALSDLSAYSVTVFTQPTGPRQTCTVANGSGNIVGANVSDVQVSCETNIYTVGGTVSGLEGSGLVLQNNGADDLPITANGAFTFATALTDLSAYAVTVFAEPTDPGQTCTVANGTGNLAGADVANVAVNCVTNTYTVGGTVTGLEGSGLVLRNNDGDDLPIAADGSFTFAAALDDLSAYSVTVFTQPTGPSQTCTVANGSGNIVGANVSDVAVSCVTNTYSVGGSVSGLQGRGLVLQNNGGDDLPIAVDGSFMFSIELTDASAYAVTVSTQPSGPGQTCTVGDGSGTLDGANVSDVTVSCEINTFTIGGTLSGLASGASVTLQNNGGDNLTLSDNGSFTFASALDDLSAYAVTVLTQPTSPSQNCTVNNGSGDLAGANVTNIAVNCEINTYTVGGTVSGLTGSGLLLSNNGSDELSIAGNGPFTFATALDDGAAYLVSAVAQPDNPNQWCTVTNGAGQLDGANVTNVLVDCADLRVDVMPSQLDFGDVDLGDVSDAEIVLVENTGQAVVQVAVVNVAGPAAAEYAVLEDTCTSVLLEAGQFCGIEVAFAPTQAGVREAQLMITVDRFAEPFSVGLVGTSDVIWNNGFERQD